jgi:hypothetical protein
MPRNILRELIGKRPKIAQLYTSVWETEYGITTTIIERFYQNTIGH